MENVVDSFIRIASNHPDRDALNDGVNALTYSELHCKSDGFASALIERGISKGDRVALIMDKSIDFVIAIIGIMKAGAAYLPIDPSYPKDHIEYILSDANPHAIITKIDVNRDLNSRNFSISSDGTLAAYIIYTSGSTGMPKGVVVRHSGLYNTIDAALRYFDDPVSCLLLGAVSFDLSSLLLFLSICSGGTIYMPTEANYNMSKLSDTVNSKKINLLFTVPSHYYHFLEQEVKLSNIGTVFIGGEKVTPYILERHRQLNPQVSLYNAYGPTECSIISTIACLHHPGQPPRDTITIGKPIPNTHVWILDDNLKPVPDGQKGEICMSGVGLAQGYLNNPKLTAEKFVEVSLNGQPIRIYRSGDYGRSLPDGSVEFVDRIDHQVKVNGYRIELSLIEDQILSFPGISQAVVLTQDQGQGHLRLVVFYVANSEVDKGELRVYLKGKLPRYMLPVQFLQLSALPLTPNSKIDRSALTRLLVHQPSDQSFNSPDELSLELSRLWEKITDLSQIDPHQPFFDMGGDSVQMAQALAAIEVTFNINISLTTLFKYPSIHQLASHIYNLKKGGSAPENGSSQRRARSFGNIRKRKNTENKD